MVSKKRHQGNRELLPVLEVGSECCLRHSPESLRSVIRKALTFNNPKYLEARRYSRWIGKQLKPKLYFYRDQDDTIIFPRGFGNRAVCCCRQLLGVSPQIIDNRRKLIEENFVFQGELRPYQKKAVKDVVARSFGVLEAGTGSGKTVMALKVIVERRQPTIIIVHSRELMFQWLQRIETFLGIKAGQAGGGHYHLRPVTVAIVNTARRRIDDLIPNFGQIIVDECHRVPASLFTDVVNSFDAYYMLGLSATAFRREDEMTSLIYAYMGDRVHTVDSRELAASGAIVRPDFVQHETSFSCVFRGEYAKLIKALAKDEERNRQIASDIVELVEKGHPGTILVVSDRVAHCQALARMLQKNDLVTALLTGRVPPRARAGIVERVQRGKVEVLLSTLQLIGEGFDCPGLSTLVLATPIKFKGRLLQVVGRIMRPVPGNREKSVSKKALVVDYVDVNVPVLKRSAEARAEMFARWYQD